MTLEQQVISLDLAKQMKELEFKDESLFYWLNDNHGYQLVCEDGEDGVFITKGIESK